MLPFSSCIFVNVKFYIHLGVEKPTCIISLQVHTPVLLIEMSSNDTGANICLDLMHVVAPTHNICHVYVLIPGLPLFLIVILLNNEHFILFFCIKWRSPHFFHSCIVVKILAGLNFASSIFKIKIQLCQVLPFLLHIWFLNIQGFFLNFCRFMISILSFFSFSRCMATL